MYAKIENGVAVEYPLYEGDLEQRFPEYTFPLDSHLEENNGVLCPEGYVRVAQTYVQNQDPRKRYIPTGPQLDETDGVWKLGWAVEDLSLEEIEANKPRYSILVRSKRNNKLLSSDPFVLSDRWETYTEEEKNTWRNYRQGLRDIPNQEGFPYEIIWPTPPVEIPEIQQGFRFPF